MRATSGTGLRPDCEQVPKAVRKVRCDHQCANRYALGLESALGLCAYFALFLRANFAP